MICPPGMNSSLHLSVINGPTLRGYCHTFVGSHGSPSPSLLLTCLVTVAIPGYVILICPIEPSPTRLLAPVVGTTDQPPVVVQLSSLTVTFFLPSRYFLLPIAHCTGESSAVTWARRLSGSFQPAGGPQAPREDRTVGPTLRCSTHEATETFSATLGFPIHLRLGLKRRATGPARGLRGISPGRETVCAMPLREDGHRHSLLSPRLRGRLSFPPRTNLDQV
jgi:hypothetical protein